MKNPNIQRILREEIELFAKGQKILAEHRRLVARGQDFHSQAALFLIEELTGKPVDPDQLDESIWGKAKFMLGKMGSLERGKLFGRKSKKYKAAVEQLEAALEKAAGQLARGLKNSLPQKYENFPNNEDQEDFVKALMIIGEAYDSIRDRVTSGEMQYDVGQPVVESLRQLVLFYLDNELADVYKHFNEQEEEVKGKFTKVGAGEEDYAKDSGTVKGLESNLAPAVLAASGVLSGVLGAAPWFQQLLSTAPANPTAAATTVQKILGPMDGEGFTQMLGRLTQGNPAHFSASAAPKELFAAMQSVGIDPTNPKALFKLGVDPAAYQSALASGATTIGDMFPASNTALYLDKGASVVTSIVKGLTKAKAGAAAATAAAGVNPVLATLGLGAAAAGAAVKLLRMKGLRSSRAQLLRDLANEMQDLPQPEATPGGDPQPGPETKPGPETPPPPKPPAPNVTRLGLARLDDDGVDIFIGTRRNKDERQKELDMMKQAQDDAPVGSDSTPTSRQIDTALRQLKRRPDANTLDYDDLQKAVKGRSKKEPEIFITVDASVRQHVAQALKAVGAIKDAAVTDEIKAAVDAASEKMVDRFAASKKKQTPRQARIIAARELKKAGIEDLEFDDFKPIVKVFQDYGLVRPGELTPGRKRKRKGAEKPLPKTGNPPPPRRTKAAAKSPERQELEDASASVNRQRAELGLAERLGDLDHITDAAHEQLFENLVKKFTK